jgi:hypothetical protein
LKSLECPWYDLGSSLNKAVAIVLPYLVSIDRGDRHLKGIANE